MEVGAWLQEAIEATELGVNQFLALLAKEGASTNASRLKKYCRGVLLPEPDTLRAICHVAKISYVEAIDRFGYYREIIKLFDDLVWLGDCWMEEDDAYGRAIRLDGRSLTIDAQGRATRADGTKLPRVDTIHFTGVIYWKGRPITFGRPAPLTPSAGCDPREDPAFTGRYFVGVWRDEIPPMPRDTPQIVRDYYKHDRGASTIVPKPIAVAILLAALVFPWRGDLYKEESPQYRYDLAKAAEPLAGEAIGRRSSSRAVGRPKKLHPFLQRACAALDDSSIPFNSRRPIAAEYIVIWADTICQEFTHYARLAAYDLWGEAGGRQPSAPPTAILQAVPGETTEARVSFPSVFTRLPQIRHAALPEIETLTTYT